MWTHWFILIFYTYFAHKTYSRRLLLPFLLPLCIRNTEHGWILWKATSISHFMMIFLRVASKNWFFTKKIVQRVTIVNYTYSPFYSPFIKLLFSNYSRWMEHKTFIWLCLKVYQFCSVVPWPKSLSDSVLWLSGFSALMKKAKIIGEGGGLNWYTP